MICQSTLYEFCKSGAITFQLVTTHNNTVILQDKPCQDTATGDTNGKVCSHRVIYGMDSKGVTSYQLSGIHTLFENYQNKNAGQNITNNSLKTKATNKVLYL